MGLERCPSCAATVRPDAEWCTLCYADLRPAPVVPAARPYPQPAAAPAYPAPPPPAPPIGPPADALHAPYEHVLAAVYGDAAPASATASSAAAQATTAQAPATKAPAAPSTGAPAKPIGWPCTKCGEINDFERSTCSVCTAPFGADLRSATPEIDRKKVMTIAITAAVAFLALVAAITFITTKAPATDSGNTGGSAPSQVEQTDVPQDPQAPAVDAPVATVPEPASSAIPGQNPPAQPVVPGQPDIPGATYVPGQNLLQSNGAVPAP